MAVIQRVRLLLAGCAINATWYGPAATQVTNETQQSAAKTRSVTEDVVVTAQRRSQRLVDVPASVSVVSGRTLERAGVKSVLDLDQVTVGTKVERQGGFVQPAIRGISTLTTGLGFENNVALYIDGFYQPDTVSLASGLGEISGVEVLKGPQGTLYGRNATGGAILINTPDPSKTWTGNIEGSYARFNDHIVQGYLSGPIGNGDLASFNVSAYNRYSDGYIRYTLGQRGDASPLLANNLRTKLKLTPTDDITVTLGYAHVYLNDPFGLTFVYPDYSPFPDSLHATQPDTATENIPSKDSVTVNSYTDKTVVKLPFGTLTSRTGYDERSTELQYDYDGSLIPVVNVHSPATQQTFQQALDLQITSVRNLDLLVGGFYYNDNSYIYDQEAVILGNQLSASNERLRSNAGAIYGSATYHFGRFALTGGIRGNIERRNLDYDQTKIGTNPIVPPGRQGKTFVGATPSASLSYAVSHSTSVYASYSTGYRSGVFEPTPVPTPAEIKPIKPERITAFEIGAKTSQSFWTLNAAAFYYIFRDLQVGVVEPDPVNPGGAVIEAIINAYKATTYGAEVEGTMRPIEGLSVNGGLALLHARYSSFEDAVGAGFDPATRSNVTPQPQNWDGQQTSRAPTVTANLGSNYGFDLAGGQMNVSANATYTSSFIPNDPSLYGPLAGPALADKQRYRVGPYALLNANVGWTDSSNHYTISVFATNLTNTHYLIVYNGSSFGDSKAYGQPAQYGIRLGYKF